MLDIHAHLYWKSYDADRDVVVRRAREAGVKKIICVGTSPEDDPQALAVAEKYDDVYASVGLHPHFFNEQKEGMLGMTMEDRIEELKSLAKHPKVIAIGECGLDYFGREAPITEERKARQKEGFIAQIELAEELKLPVIIHTRPSLGSVDVYEDVLDILGGQVSLYFILHCYQGDTEITKKFLELSNVYFSFAGNITYPIKKIAVGTKDDLRETLSLVPLNRLFVETDCPFLAPEGKRGERNEPSYVWMTAEKVCEAKGVTMADLETVLDENFQRVFAGDFS